MEGSDQEPLLHWQHNKDLGNCMIELYKNRLWTDVKFRCKDHDEGERISAHKVVLAARSPVFQAMFFGPCADGKDEVDLTNAVGATLDIVLRYIYSDTVTLTKENASAVLEMAHYYQVTNLVQFCADYLATIITPENACGILTLAMFYKVTTLRDACCTFIDRNADEILNSEGFLELPDDCLTYILKGDTFYADENNIFIKAEDWARRKIGEVGLEKTGPNIRKTLGPSFYYLRLPTMTPQTLMKCIRKKGYYSVEEYEDIVDFANGHTADASFHSMTCNSCEARLPKEEILIINNSDGEPNICDGISTFFQISVSRDVKLTNLTVPEIQHHLQYDSEHYTDKNCPAESISQSDLDDFLRQNNKNVLKLTYTTDSHRVKRHRRNGSYYTTYVSYTERKAQTLKATNGEDLSDRLNMLNIAVSGNLKIKCKKTQIFPMGESNRGLKLKEEDTALTDGKQDQVSEEENKEEEDIEQKEDKNTRGAVSSEEEDELIFEQDFQSSDVPYRRIDLKEPLTLTKNASPYKIEITMHYSCTSRVKMKTFCSNTKTVTSKFGQLQLRDIAGQFAGIESIGIENISNR
ncbi:kelch-like protein 11 isoform X2 [Mercenaria mercenaria]|nr:kelch-like protein 11 isoform X2 [Mercenaria mercenaria]